MSDYVKINEIMVPTTKLKDLIRMVWHNTANKDKDLGAASKAKSLELPKPPTRSGKPKRMRSKSRQLPLHFGKSEHPPSQKQLDLFQSEPEPKLEKPHKQPKPVETEPEPKLEKPKVSSTLFSKKLDTSKPPFYQDADKWYKENFKREDVQGYTYSVRYVGPTIDDFYFVFSRYPHKNDAKSFNDYYDNRQRHMQEWNLLAKEYAKKKWPNEFAGMNEQFKLQK